MAMKRRIAAAAAAVIALCAVPSVSHADESAVRERVHARVTVIMEDAVATNVFSAPQEAYVAGAILPAYIDARDLPNRVEARTIESFWEIVEEGTGSSTELVQARLRAGSTLIRIAGDNADDLQERLYRWLSRPVVEAQFDGRITSDESTDLRDDIDRAVARVMAQPGGERDVVLVPRRD